LFQFDLDKTNLPMMPLWKRHIRPRCPSF